jgi:hypothetical protein
VDPVLQLTAADIFGRNHGPNPAHVTRSQSGFRPEPICPVRIQPGSSGAARCAVAHGARSYRGDAEREGFCRSFAGLGVTVFNPWDAV